MFTGTVSRKARGVELEGEGSSGDIGFRVIGDYLATNIAEFRVEFTAIMKNQRK